MGGRYLEAMHVFFNIRRYDCVEADGVDDAGFDGKASLERAKTGRRSGRNVLRRDGENTTPSLLSSRWGKGGKSGRKK